MNLERVIAVRTSKTVYRDGDKVVKVFDKEYSKVDVLNEALNQAIVENLGLNIPKIYSVETVDGKWAIVSEYIKGKTLADLIKLNPDKILVMTHADPEVAKKAVSDELSKELWQNVNAVKNNDITYLENGYFGMSANLQIVEAVEKLGDILYE